MHLCNSVVFPIAWVGSWRGDTAGQVSSGSAQQGSCNPITHRVINPNGFVPALTRLVGKKIFISTAGSCKCKEIFNKFLEDKLARCYILRHIQEIYSYFFSPNQDLGLSSCSLHNIPPAEQDQGMCTDLIYSWLFPSCCFQLLFEVRQQ